MSLDTPNSEADESGEHPVSRHERLDNVSGWQLVEGVGYARFDEKGRKVCQIEWKGNRWRGLFPKAGKVGNELWGYIAEFLEDGESEEECRLRAMKVCDKVLLRFFKADPAWQDYRDSVLLQ